MSGWRIAWNLLTMAAWSVWGIEILCRLPWATYQVIDWNYNPELFGAIACFSVALYPDRWKPKE